MHAFINGLLEVCRDTSKIGTKPQQQAHQCKRVTRWMVLEAKHVRHCGIIQVAWKYLNTHFTLENNMVH